MAYPSPPDISTSYTAQEQALGDGTLPGQELDVDLASVRASITAIIEFLKTSIRSDGKLNNGSVGTDTLASSLLIGFDAPAPWMTGAAYTTRSTVFSGFGFYLCVTAHTSSVFATDLASGRWVLLADLTPPGGALIAASNLSDVPDKAAARSNLLLGSLATVNSGVGASDVRTNLQNDGRFQPLLTTLTAWGALTRAAGFDTFVANPTSANLRALLTDESGAGALLFAGGALGTPASVDLANATGLPFAGLAAAAVTTAAETIAANNVDTQVPTSAAVKAYVDSAPKVTSATSQATTSGTSVDWTSIPANINEFRFFLNGVSANGTSSLLVQLGTSGGIVSTGYTGTSLSAVGSSVSVGGGSAGLIIGTSSAADVHTGEVVGTRVDPAGDIWSLRFEGTRTVGSTAYQSSYARVDLGAALTQLRLTTVGGANTFDLGSATISW